MASTITRVPGIKCLGVGGVFVGVAQMAFTPVPQLPTALSRPPHLENCPWPTDAHLTWGQQKADEWPIQG